MNVSTLLLALLQAGSPTAPAKPAATQATAPAATPPATAKQEPAHAAANPAGLGVDDARSVVSKAARYLLAQQNKDGSWCSNAIETLSEAAFGFSLETWYCFKIGANGLAIQALLALDETPQTRAALERALGYFCDARIPLRGNEWDVDYAWSNVEGFAALVVAAQDPRFAAEPWKSRIQKRALEYYALLEKTQDPLGGWGYYEGAVVSQRPTWSTSFTTASVVPALADAKNVLHWPVNPKVLDWSLKYVKGCALPNGAYEYDLNAVPRISGGEHINNVKGSLGRIQVCNWARRRAGDASVTDDKLRAGLQAFFDDHKFLDEARLRPIPHEGYYAVAAYFYFFGHCYAGQAIELLPAAERESWHRKLRAEIAKCQWQDGSFMDFLGSSHMQIASTSFAILALQAGLRTDAPKAK